MRGRRLAAILTVVCALWIASTHATINTDTNWWVMVGGNNADGCGYRAGLTGGVNKANTPSPALSGANGSTNGTTSFSVTSGAPFTDNSWRGNFIQIASDGWYEIQTVTNTTTVVVDRNTANGGSGRTFRIGGACANLQPFSTTSTLGAPSLTTPLAAGHVVNIEGTAGTTLQSLPTSPTYTGWGTGYTFPTGTNVEAGGLIKFLAYNGIVRLDIGNTFAQVSGTIWQGFEWMSTATGDGWMMLVDQSFSPPLCSWVYDSVFDQNGYGAGGTNLCNIVSVGFLNSNSGSVSTALSAPAVKGTASEPQGTAYGRIMGSTFKGWKTDNTHGTVDHPNFLTIEFNIFDSNTAQACVSTITAAGNSSLLWNSFRNCSGDAILTYHCCPPVEFSYLIRNNVIVGSGGIGLNFSNSDTTRVPARFNLMPDYNAYLANSGGTYSAAATAGPHDVALGVDPWVDAANGNFRLNTAPTGGALLTATGWPRFFVGLPGT